MVLWMGKSSDGPDHPSLILISAKCDLGWRGEGLAVSSVTGEGIEQLTRCLVAKARDLLPKGDELSLDRRQHQLLQDAFEALSRAQRLRDPILVAEELRTARQAIDRISGKAGVEDLLDALFSRFCLGK